jgi:hypothetical protein
MDIGALEAFPAHEWGQRVDDVSVPDEGQRSERRIVLCPRGDRLVGFVFATIEALSLAPAKTEIDQMIDSIRWRPA